MTLERLTIDGLTVHVARPPATGAPGRPPILLVHGMFGGAWYFERYQRFFAARGYPAFALDLRGHHGSRPVEDLGRVTLADYVDDARAVARHLGRPIVLGHSMGGLMAQRLAEEDAVAAAVLVASAPPRGITPATPMLVRKQLKHAWAIVRQRTVMGSFRDHLAMSLNRTPPDEARLAYDRLVPESGRASLELSIGAIAVDAARVRCPMMGIVGRDDRFIVPRVMRAIARKYDMPLVEVPGHGHFIVTEPGWEGPAGMIADWLESAAIAT